MSKGQRLTMHGRDHRPGGADPIPGLSGGGIQFDTDNEGDWLFIQTNDSTAAGGSLHGYGIDLRDADTNGLGINIQAQESVRIAGNGASILWGHNVGFGFTSRLGVEDDINIEAGRFFGATGDINLTANNGAINIHSGGTIDLESVSGDIHLFPDSGDVIINGQNNTIQVGGPNGVLLLGINDSTGTSVVRVVSQFGLTITPTFEIRADGTVHGLASVGSITWDL